MKKVLLIALFCTLIDQIIKNGFILSLSFGDSINVISNFFSLTLVPNTGAAFSILSSNTILLSVIGLIALNLIYFFFVKDKNLSKKENILYGMLMGGILGNLIDRIFRGYVIDYLDFNILGFDYPVFNFADILITVSIILIIIDIIRGDKNEVSSK